MWYHGGRKVSSATIHRSGKTTKSTFAVPGLQNGAMGIFNAWVDQVPMMVLRGIGTG